MAHPGMGNFDQHFCPSAGATSISTIFERLAVINATGCARFHSVFLIVVCVGYILDKRAVKWPTSADAHGSLIRRGFPLPAHLEVNFDHFAHQAIGSISRTAAICCRMHEGSPDSSVQGHQPAPECDERE